MKLAEKYTKKNKNIVYEFVKTNNPKKGVANYIDLGVTGYEIVTTKRKQSRSDGVYPSQNIKSETIITTKFKPIIKSSKFRNIKEIHKYAYYGKIFDSGNE